MTFFLPRISWQKLEELGMVIRQGAAGRLRVQPYPKEPLHRSAGVHFERLFSHRWPGVGRNTKTGRVPL